MAVTASLTIACALEAVIGDPEGWPHPVRGIGKLIERAEPLARRAHPDPRRAGALLVAGILFATVVPLEMIRRHFRPRVVFDGVVLYLALAINQLVTEGRLVHALLESDDLAAARRELSRIVSRDTSIMTEEEVVRGAIESLAENFSDAFFAPLFYFAIGGPAAAVAYKTINTMDSMIGYRNERYFEFGRAAAKLDDAVNWIPARLAGLVLVAAAPLARCSGSDALRIMRRDGQKHESPNAGIGKAAVAGALGVRLGGPVVYAHGTAVRPFIGDDVRLLDRRHILEAARLLTAAAILSIGFAWAWMRR